MQAQAEGQQKQFADLAAKAGRAVAHTRRGEAAKVSATVAEITGTAPRSIEQFARDYAPAFGGAGSA